MSLALRVAAWMVLPLTGAGLGLLLLALPSWLLGLPWVPMQGPLELVDSIPAPWDLVGVLTLGVVGGLVLVLLWLGDRLIVTVDGSGISLVRGDDRHRVDRAGVTATFLDGKDLVVLGRDDDELARQEADLDAGALRDAFVQHGYPWHDADPHAAAFRAWAAGSPELPPGADGLLRARRHAVRNKRDEEAAELREELQRLGLVIRDEAGRQHWRPAKAP